MSAEALDEATLERARALLQGGRIEDSVALVEALLSRNGDDADGWYLLAVCRRYLKQTGAAQAALDRLKVLRPEFGRAHQEQGHLCRLSGRSDAALVAYEQAVRCNPALPSSWRSLAQLYAARGDAAASRRADAQYRRLAEQPPELVSVASFLHEGLIFKAERLCRAYLQRHPHHPEAMRLLAAIGVELHVLDDAEFLLDSVLTFAPDFQLARVDYVRVLQRRQKFADALAEARRLRDGDPGNPAFASLYADASMAAGEYDTALAVYDALLAEHPDDAHVNLARGHALKTVGRRQDAIAAYRRACRSRPDFGDAYWSLANLKTYRFSDAEIEVMREREAAAGLPDVDRYHLCFALGKALEDRGEFTEAFACFARGNALKRAELGYRPERLEQAFARQRAVFTTDLMRRRAGSGCPAADPIFIVGLPRAGSTLLEQVLASHSQVDGTFELPNVLAMAHRLGNPEPGPQRSADEPRYPAVVADLEAEALTRLGRQYLDETLMHRGEAPFFTDKMPNNFRHLGLIHLILPNARIIDARRHPMACCVSGFKQLFAEGQEFSYSLEDLGRYYRGYVTLMEHWQTVMPERILRVRHEDVVADLEGQVRRLLAFLELPFEPACLDFHKTERSVRTASSEQVRQPLYDSALDHWRHYERWLDPLRSALGPAIDA